MMIFFKAYIFIYVRARIRILKIVHDDLVENKIEVTARFIDSGLEITTTPAKIRAVPDWALGISPFAIHCSLIIHPADYYYEGDTQAEGSSWAPSINDALAQLGKYHTAEELTAHLGLELHCVKTVRKLLR